MILQMGYWFEAVRHWLAEQPGHHGFSEMLYEYHCEPNGSGFEGLTTILFEYHRKY
jgi:K+-transporting ATPase ATPase A chain